MRWKVGCGGEFSAPSGQITSPNYPQRYGDNLVCNYTITAAPDTYIVDVFFDRFDIENHPLCVHDRVSAYQGNSTSSPMSWPDTAKVRLATACADCQSKFFIPPIPH